MSLYVVLDEKLSHGKFGVLTKGDKFNADENEVTELLEAKSIKPFKGKVHEAEEHAVLSEKELLDKGVSQSDIDIAVAEGNELGESVEVVKPKKKGKKQ